MNVDTRGWTMEQHEAAAAALGAMAAKLMRMGAPAPTSYIERDQFASGLVRGADQVARWIAREAWRHAAAVLREADATIEALERQPLDARAHLGDGDGAAREAGLSVVCCDNWLTCTKHRHEPIIEPN